MSHITSFALSLSCKKQGEYAHLPVDMQLESTALHDLYFTTLFCPLLKRELTSLRKYLLILSDNTL